MSTMNIGKIWSWKTTTLALGIGLVLLVSALAGATWFFFRNSFSQELTSANNGKIPVIRVLSHPQVSASMATPFDWSFTSGGNLPMDPWDQLNSIHQRMEQLFQDSFDQMTNDSSFPALDTPGSQMDIRDGKDHYTIRVDMPGADKSSIKVNVEGQTVMISGRRVVESETKEKGKIVRGEQSVSEYSRTVDLPGPVKVEGANAKYDNGVLTLTLPKAAPSAATTTIPVH